MCGNVDKKHMKIGGINKKDIDFKKKCSRRRFRRKPQKTKKCEAAKTKEGLPEDAKVLKGDEARRACRKLKREKLRQSKQQKKDKSTNKCKSKNES